MMIRRPQSQKGFVILFAVLISAIILLIGIGIFRITVKETILSSSARESTIAFFAADGGLECALYEIIKDQGFTTPGRNTVTCNGQTILYNYSEGPGVDATFRAELPVGCAKVEVDTNYFDKGVIYNRIVSRGYNICEGDSPDSADPVLLERVIELKYAAF